MKSFQNVLLLLLTAYLLQSCMAPKKAIYANDMKQGKDTTDVTLFSSKHKIQVADLLQVQVQGLDPTVVQEYNMNLQGGNIASTTGGRGIGQRVSATGTIVVPIVGEVSVVGLTVEEAGRKIQSEIAKFIKDPTVLVSLLNFKVSVLGAVRSPGVYNSTTDRYTILDALAQAGDIQLSGLRDRVWVVREESGIRTYDKVNLNSSSLFKSDYYYLKNNDVIYIQPNSLSAFAGSNAALFSVLGATLGIIALIISITN